MIADTMDHLPRYKTLFPYCTDILRWYQQINPETLQPGRYEINGNNLFALVQEYDTVSEESCQMEMHAIYADIQCLVEGEEIIGFDNCIGREINVPADTDKASYDSPRKFGYTYLIPNTFAAFFPGEGHMPCISMKGITRNKKIVFKCRC